MEMEQKKMGSMGSTGIAGSAVSTGVAGIEEAKEFVMDFSEYPMTDEQKFIFDLKGYLVIPDVFNADEVAAMKEQVYKIRHEPESLAPHERTVPGGASEVLLKNKLLRGILGEIIGHDLRLDNQFCIWRTHGVQNLRPHAGGPTRSPQTHYHFTNGQISSRLTRVAIELNPVRHQDGGTVFLPGSHKANYKVPESLKVARDDNYEPHFETYEASPGSVVLFTENLCHAGPTWKNTVDPRVSIFLAFCDIGMRTHRRDYVTQEVIDGLGPEARWYFRDIWPWDNNGGADGYKNGGKNKLLVREDGSYIVSP